MRTTNLGRPMRILRITVKSQAYRTCIIYGFTKIDSANVAYFRSENAVHALKGHSRHRIEAHEWTEFNQTNRIDFFFNTQFINYLLLNLKAGFYREKRSIHYVASCEKAHKTN